MLNAWTQVIGEVEGLWGEGGLVWEEEVGVGGTFTVFEGALVGGEGSLVGGWSDVSGGGAGNDTRGRVCSPFWIFDLRSTIHDPRSLSRCCRPWSDRLWGADDQ
jgi:hypothetical protein